MRNTLMIENDIKNKIYIFREVEVMLDRDLAKLYEVENKGFKSSSKTKY